MSIARGIGKSSRNIYCIQRFKSLIYTVGNY